MTAFKYRDERICEETLSVIADQAFGAIKDWQLASEDRPKLSAAVVREAADDYLREVGEHPDCAALIDPAVRTLLIRLDRMGAAAYL